MKKEGIASLILVILLVLISDVWLYETAWNNGYGASVDDMTKIMDKQVKSDTTVSRVWLLGADTNVYVLNTKYRKLK